MRKSVKITIATMLGLFFTMSALLLMSITSTVDDAEYTPERFGILSDMLEHCDLSDEEYVELDTMIRRGLIQSSLEGDGRIINSTYDNARERILNCEPKAIPPEPERSVFQQQLENNSTLITILIAVAGLVSGIVFKIKSNKKGDKNKDS